MKQLKGTVFVEIRKEF